MDAKGGMNHQVKITIRRVNDEKLIWEDMYDGILLRLL